jgi:hypothetical protein
MLDPTPVAGAPAPRPASGPSIEAIHYNVGLSNTYRMELIRTLLAISAALFAFTVTFGPTLKPVEWKEAMWIGWAGLAVSMIGGFVHLLGWDHYFKSYRDVDWRLRRWVGKPRARKFAKRVRRRINLWRRTGMVAQYAGCVVGVAGVGCFASANIDHAAPKSAPQMAFCCSECAYGALSGTAAANATSVEIRR